LIGISVGQALGEEATPEGRGGEGCVYLWMSSMCCLSFGTLSLLNLDRSIESRKQLSFPMQVLRLFPNASWMKKTDEVFAVLQAIWAPGEGGKRKWARLAQRLPRGRAGGSKRRRRKRRRRRASRAPSRTTYPLGEVDCPRGRVQLYATPSTLVGFIRLQAIAAFCFYCVTALAYYS